MFSINGLDHVAIRVRDMEKTIAWYEQVLGLKKYTIEEWGPYPVFLLACKTGIAVFPAELDGWSKAEQKKRVCIDHFAFNVDRQAFDSAVLHYQKLGLSYSIQDHQYFDSIYTLDPDGHTVELTTLKVPESDFYDMA
jgi:catechol 2,3-dioxygenase-like lactoylglutathione lyase family enzyme